MKIRDLKWIKDYWWESETILGKFIIYCHPTKCVEMPYYWESRTVKTEKNGYIGDYSISSRDFGFNYFFFKTIKEAKEHANKYWKKIAKETLDDILIEGE